MKKILLFTCVIALFTTTGCIFPGRGDHRGHDHDRDRGAVVAPSAVAVQVPEVNVAPPLVEVRVPEVVVR